MTAQDSEDTHKTILVCGLGIIGLTTSISLLKAGYAVTAIASHLPTDPLSPYYASSAAGAHHLSFAADDDPRQQSLDRRTFEVLWAEEEEEGEGSGVMKVVQREFYVGGTHIAFFETLPDFRVCTPDECPSWATHAVTFTSLTMDSLAYLRKLLARFEALGGVIHRATLPSLAAALAFLPDSDKAHPPPLALVNCAGLGSRDLEDVRDEAMYPVRGQVLVLRAPWVKEGWTKQVGKDGDGERTYVIPRRSGEVVIGGTRDVDDW
ncbi:hypothetical protein H0H92_006940 [Tricholoma furcatifolium]|nr:hypothetical protein H0H92_006940 [Tricholoma furcatifolium]